MLKTELFGKLEVQRSSGRKSLAVLIDPDKVPDPDALNPLLSMAGKCPVDFFFVGGSLMTRDNLTDVVTKMKEACDIPVVLFPGNSMQLCDEADAILFLSLISGRNPDFLIGQHVNAAPWLSKSRLEVIPTGYMIINSENTSAVCYMSNTMPIPHDKYSIATSTALAGEMLGMKLIYIDAGSGSKTSISAEMISRVRAAVNIPLIIGGGITDRQQVRQAVEAGADVVVIGNAIEKNKSLMREASDEISAFNESLSLKGTGYKF